MPNGKQDPCQSLTGAKQQDCIRMRAIFADRAIVQGPLCELTTALPPRRTGFLVNQLAELAMSLPKPARLALIRKFERPRGKKAAGRSGSRSEAKAKRK